jgi:carboxypeptidase C (cathepsin A)
MTSLLYHTGPAGTSKDRVKFAYYECGHMMYIRKADLIKAKGDLAEFIRSSLPRP